MIKNHSKLRVAHVVGSLQIGGAENQVVKLLNGFDRRIIQPILVLFKKEDTAFSRALAPHVERFIVPLAPRGQISLIWRLKRFLADNQIDVVQAHMSHTNLYVAIAARMAGTPVVITTDHGLDPWKKSVHHWIERNIISPLADMRVVVSRNIAENRLQFGDIPAHKITIIRNCIWMSQAQQPQRAGTVLRIGTVGRLVPEKDYETLLQAFKILVEKGIFAELTFLGDGPEITRLQYKSQNLGIESQVKFMGLRTDVSNFLEEFDIFVLSSISEGIPVALLEAMATGLPVVATRVGGIPEVIEDRVDGLLVPAQDPEAMATAIRYLAENEALRGSLGKTGQIKVKEYFSCETACRKYESLYLELFKKKVESALI